ncbi:unnamed protein product, partial [Effrenium voratum]
GFAQNQFATSWNGSIAHWLGTHRPRHCPLPKGEGVYGPTGRTLIRPNFGRACCWLAACTAALGILMAFWAPRSRWWFRGALCQSEVVPKHLAVSLPVMIMACLFFLLGSNYLLMAQTFVNLEQAPNFVWNAFQVMVYSLFYSIDALYYEAHLQAMSWVLLCFSAILPYVKLLLMLLGWLAPKNLLPLRIRSFILAPLAWKEFQIAPVGVGGFFQERVSPISEFTLDELPDEPEPAFPRAAADFLQTVVIRGGGDMLAMTIQHFEMIFAILSSLAHPLQQPLQQPLQPMLCANNYYYTLSIAKLVAQADLLTVLPEPQLM